jgi:NRPS condensation-like uncharacterized protein
MGAAPRERFPFTLGEELFHLLDSPDEPATVHVELRVTGHLDDAALREAVAVATAMHPMARVSKAAGRILARPAQWETRGPPTGEVVHSTSCTDEPAMSAIRTEFYSRPISLTRAPALRVLLVKRPGGDSLLLSANHAIADGMGTLRFVNSVARAYARAPDPVPDIDPLRTRNLRSYFGPSLSSRPPVDPEGSPKGPRSRIAPDPDAHESGYGLIQLSFPLKRSDQIGSRRPLANPTVNDLLLASLHLTIGSWNAERDAPCHIIASIVPVNVRPAEWRHEVVANLVMAGSVVSTPEERSSEQSLLASVGRQTRRIKSGHDFARVLAAPAWTGVLVLGRLRLEGPRMLDSAAVLSNLGRVDPVSSFGRDAGDVSELWFSPPAVMPVGLGIGAVGLRDRLHVAIRYRRALFGRRAAQGFADSFRNWFATLSASSAPTSA